MHSNKNVSINSGTFTIKSGDDGIHAEKELTVNGGSLEIRQSYEGLEGFNIVINDGDIKLTSSDDGVNAAGKSEELSEDPVTNKKGGMASEDQGKRQFR